MRRLLLLVLFVLVATPARAEEPAAETRVFVELVTERALRYVGEAVPVRLRLGYDAAWFEKHAVPLFQQEVDLAVHVRIPWLSGTDGFEVLEPLPSGSTQPALPALAVNDSLVAWRRADEVERGGRRYTVLELPRRLLPSDSGALVLGGPVVRFAYATQFEEGFMDERVPLDRKEATVSAEPLRLTVSELPAMGRPSAFIDAIGSFQVQMRLSTDTVDVGDPVRVTLVLTGKGNLERLTPPPASRFTGFHAFGAIDDKGALRRTITYEIAPTSADVTEVPSIEFAYFDPTPPATYRSLPTPPMPLTVRGAAGTDVAEPEAGAPTDPVPGGVEGEADEDGRPQIASVLIVVLLALCAGMLVWALRLRRRLRAAVASDADGSLSRSRDALAALRASAGRPAAERERGLVAYLAAELGTARAAVVAPSLADRLGRAGIPADLAARTAALVEELVAGRYGAPLAAAPDAVDDQLIQELHDAFERAR